MMVSIEKCADYSIENVRTALCRTFDNLGGMDRFIRPGMKVVLKPNLVLKKRPEEVATTHPVLVQVVASMVHRIVSQKEGGKVIIAESPGGLYSERALSGVYSVCGMEKAAKESGVELNYDVSEVEVDNPDGKYMKKVTIIKPLADADLIINLPKLKTHGQMVYTGAVKNMYGAVPGVLKLEYHFRMKEYDRFANAIIDIFLSVKPALNIIDAVVGMDGLGPSAGNPKQIGVILAGDDAFELDFTALDMLKVPPLRVPVIKEAVDRGLCPASIEDIEYTGERVEDVRIEDFDVPQLETLRSIEFFNNGIFRHFMGLMKPKPVFIYELCAGCAECERSCPAKVIEMCDKKPKIDLSKCIRCFCCQELCPARAITIRRPPIANFLLKMSKKI